MICPNCKKEGGDGNFCVNCGTKLVHEQKDEYTAKPTPHISPNVPMREPTLGEKTLTKLFHWLFYLSVALLTLTVLSKLSYQEKIEYGYETDDSDGYFIYGNSTKGDREQIVLIHVTPLFFGSNSDWFYTNSGHYYSPEEVDSDLDRLHQEALDEYQKKINSLIIYILIATIILFVLDKYVTNICKTKNN